MTGKEASVRPLRGQKWGARLSLLVAAIVILAVCFTLQRLWGPDSAKAQGPRNARRTNPAPVTAAPGRTNSSRSASQSASQAPRSRGGQKNESGVVAVVNSEQITRQQLGRECVQRYGEDVLESLVNKHLIWQECQQRGISITEEDVNGEVSRMAGKFGLSVDHWLMMLERERDITADKYRRDIVWPTLALRRLAASKLKVTQAEVQEAFESEYGPKVKVRMIAVSSRQKADELWKKARENPEEFSDLAKEHSEDVNSASASGLLPPIRKHVGHEEVEKAAFSLEEGEVSRVIEVADQFLIFKCESHIPESYVSSEQIKQIESQLHDRIRDQKLRAAASDLFAQLQEKADVVNVFDDRERREQMPGVAATVNGQKITMRQLIDECLLRHGKEVLEGEINRTVLIQELKRRGKQVTDAAIDEEVARAADSYGYLTEDGAPDVDAWLNSVTEVDNVTTDLYVRDAVWPSVALKALVHEDVEVTSEDLERGFEANYGERVQVLAVVLNNQRVANDVWEKARNNPTDQFFGELANQYSVEPVSKANFGKIPPIRKYSGQPVVEKEAFSLEPGELSGVIALGDKYIVLRCLGRTEPIVQDFDAVKDELHKDIHEKKLRVAMAEEFDRLKESAQIDNFLAGDSQPGGSRVSDRSPARVRGAGAAAGQRQSAAPDRNRR